MKNKQLYWEIKNLHSPKLVIGKMRQVMVESYKYIYPYKQSLLSQSLPSSGAYHRQFTEQCWRN